MIPVNVDANTRDRTSKGLYITRIEDIKLGRIKNEVIGTDAEVFN